MGTATVTHDLIRDGFARVEGVFSANEAQALMEAVKRLFDRESRPYSEYQAHKRRDEYRTILFQDSAWSIVLDIIGADPTIDAALERVLTSPVIRGTLEETLGTSYKLWQANIRRAEPGGEELGLHQDAHGETGLTILLSDTGRGGATAFLPGSHRWPAMVSDFGVKVNPSQVDRLLGAASGKPGDIYFFFNRTWHGRFPTTAPASALMMSFFPVGARYPIHRAPEEVLAKLGPELRRVLDPNQGVTPAGGNLVRVTGPRPPRSPELQGILTGEIPFKRLGPWGLVRAYSKAKATARKALTKVREARS